MALEGQSIGVQAWIRGKLIGAGAFGKVNLAMNREDRAVFAVKSIEWDESDAGAKFSREAIENEVQVLESLDSSFVVKCLGSDWTEESGKLMRNMFLEYMPEGSLSEFLQQFARAEPLDEHLLRTYTRSIVEGIEYLHSSGIVHCDIKGKNILVGNGSVKLTDFGSAKKMREVGEVEADLLGKFNGTPLWMAPEVVRREEQGPASDIWSLGCTVVEMATGRAPWINIADPFAALYHIGCSDETPAVPTSLSAEAHDFLAHCFERDPRKRWTSAKLLEHPFVTQRFVAVVSPKPVVPSRAPLSPTSVMQFPSRTSSRDLSSSFRNSVPLLSTPSFFKRGLACENLNETSSPVNEEEVEQSWWGNSPRSPPAGQWIVVRSPKGSCPPSPSPLPEFFSTGCVTPVVTLAIPVASQESEDSGVFKDNTLANLFIERSFFPQLSSCLVATPAQDSRHMSAASVLAGVAAAGVDGEAVNRHITFLDVVPSRNHKSNNFVMEGEQRNKADQSRSPRSLPCAMVVQEDVPSIAVCSKYLTKVRIDFKDSLLARLYSVGKQEILHSWHCLIGIERYKCVEIIREYLHWISIEYAHWFFGPGGYCMLRSNNAKSPRVKFAITIWSMMCLNSVVSMVVCYVQIFMCITVGESSSIVVGFFAYCKPCFCLPCDYISYPDCIFLKTY